MRTMSMIALCIFGWMPLRAHAHATTKSQATTTKAKVQRGNDVNLDSQHQAIRESVEAERAQLEPLFNQEQSEIAAVNADRKKSKSDKRIAVQRLRKAFLDKRNAVRLRAKMELREKLLNMKDE